MEKVMIYDLIFLTIFCVSVFWFLYSHRKNLGREGVMYMYRTQWGVKKIENFSKKYSRILHTLKYPIIIVGYLLMLLIISVLIFTVYSYLRFPQISQITKAPPVMPLIPYFTQIFNMESLMPPFYFAYFLIALVIVAVVHEFSHGIYMKLFKTKIKSTGFAFLGPILGAFVEEDKKQFYKKSNFEQMVVLGAGVFANILFALIFFILLVAFFNLSYAPAGYAFSNYEYSAFNKSDITSTRQSGNFTEVTANGKIFLSSFNESEFLERIEKSDLQTILMNFDSPAARSGLRGAIVEIDGEKIISQKELNNFLNKKKPGEIINITTIYSEEKNYYIITLAENPNNSSESFLGVISLAPVYRGILGKFISIFGQFRDYSIYYESKYNPEIAKYFYHLIWWIATINLFVGLFNMLPLGILDGGRFLYLGVLTLAKKEKTAEKSFKIATKIIGLIFLAMIVAWIFSLFNF